MKTITNCEARPRKRRLLLSLLCAGVVATFLGGCAEGPYVTAYDTGYYYPTAYYTPDYDDYYGPTYSRTIVRSGVPLLRQLRPALLQQRRVLVCDARFNGRIGAHNCAPMRSSRLQGRGFAIG